MAFAIENSVPLLPTVLVTLPTVCEWIVEQSDGEDIPQLCRDMTLHFHLLLKALPLLFKWTNL